MKKLLQFMVLGIALAAGASGVRAQSAADSAAIRATALDYVEGWYTADAARMGRALHPELAKRIMRRRGGQVALESMTAETLVNYTGRGGGKDTPAEQQQKDVAILDIFQNAASVRATMSGWIDYMHMAKGGDGRWVIVNVLWEEKSR